MQALFYKLLIRLSRRLGEPVFIIFSWFVATGYFVFFPRRLLVSIRFYRALFPDRGRPYHIGCAWRQYHNFTSVFLDRFLFADSGIEAAFSGDWQKIEAAIHRRTGGILLMSHVGNWEVAARLLRRRMKGLRLLLYLGRKQKEQIEKIQKRAVAESGLKIVVVDRGGGSPLDFMEGMTFLRSGGMVSLAGDIAWGRQRTVEVDFLGHRARLPEAPHLLALLSGAPLFVFFCQRSGRRRYRIHVEGPFFVHAPSREQRQEAVSRSAQNYAACLASAVHRHPLEWYHFEPFIG